ncbi:MAG: PHP domain-containing protein [Methanosarcinaceae archaeon]|nr:PHP domain-containing protein [Methanosarcinaceae archaeon]
MYKYDLHIHTEYSYDSAEPIKNVLDAAIKNGLDGIAICDHNTREGGLKAEEIVKNNPDKYPDFVVIPGVEVDTSEGHLVVLNSNIDIPRN